jgi:drug/metabolite transporter (DMT)-like permease
VIFGLGAALGWGLADLFAAVSGRRIGSWATVVIAQLSSALVIGLVFVLARPGDLGDLGSVAGVVVLNAFLAAGAYFTLYRALELGPIALVSPLLASYAVIPVVLAVVLLGESLSRLQVAGVTVTIVGAILTSTDLAALRAGTHRMPRSLPWAVTSTVLFGIATYVLGWAAREAGWLPTLWLSRTTTALLFALGAVAMRVRRGRAFERPVSRSSLRLPMALGALDVLGTMSYVRGAEFGLLSIVTAVSATYPLIPVFGGVRLFGERPSANQYVGVGMVVAGLILLAFA